MSRYGCVFCGGNLADGYVELDASLLTKLGSEAKVTLSFVGSETFVIDLAGPAQRTAAYECVKCRSITVTETPWTK